MSRGNDAVAGNRLSTVKWAVLLAVLLLFATQQVGLNAQFAFAASAVGAMIAVRTLKLQGAWQHVFMALGAAVVFRYIYWRATQTLPPLSDPVNAFFGAVLFLAELYSVTMLALSFFVVADPIEREDAPLIGEPEGWPTVDVFVPSYNENLDIVGTTLAAACNLDYPADRLTIYLLDDGGTDAKCASADPLKADEARERRLSLQTFCASLGVTYLTRARNEHAKAGNMNAALPRSNGDLVLVLDADHAPTRDFLRRTVGHFQRDPRLFLVQTPHFFLNPDPLEKNLGTFERMPSENEMFYSVIQKGLDKWNGTFFCGSAAVLRRAALAETGGFSGDSITEDAETALELHSRGWNSLYVDRPMIAGLQPETFVSFIGQRARWCQGMLQILMLKRPMFRKGLTIAQRLTYTSLPLFWLFPLSRLVFVAAPALYIHFDLQIYNASAQEFTAYTAFFLVANVLMQSRIYGRVRWPWISELYEYVQSIYLIRSIFSVLLHPRRPTFKVTDKGQTLDKAHLSPMAWPYFVAFTLLATTFLYGLVRLAAEGVANELLVVVTMWAAFNAVLGGVSLGVVCEKRERRRHYRLAVQRSGTLEIDGAAMPVNVEDCAIDGLNVRIRDGELPLHVMNGDTAQLLLDTGTELAYPLKVTIRNRALDGSIGLQLRAKSAVDFRAIAALLYPDHKAIQSIRDRRHTGRSVSLATLQFAGWSLVHIVRSSTFLAIAARPAPQAPPIATRPVLAAPSMVPGDDIFATPEPRSTPRRQLKAA